MSKLVLLSDIHGNAPALAKAVRREGAQADYVVLGDIHGLNAYPRKTVDIVRQLRGPKLAGNHDKAIFHKGEGHVNSEALSKFEFNHTVENISHDDLEFMSDLPYFQVMEGSPRIALTHAMPWPEKASGYEAGNAGVPKGNVPHFASIVADDYDYVFHGHTHEQYDLDCSRFGHDVHFVNPGSLGWDKTYSVVDIDSGEVEHKSVEVDHESLKEHVQSVLPDDAPHTREWF